MSLTRRALLAASLERAIARALAFDPGTRSRIKSLSGRCLAITSTEPAGSLFFSVVDDQVRVAAERDDKPDCRLTGSLTSLAGLALKPDTTTLADSDVYVEGNPGVLNQWLDLLRGVDIDWEDALAQVLGPVVAHGLATSWRAQWAWARERAQKLPRYFSELATEELRATPARNEVDEFAQDVSRLRAHTARIEARIDQLRRALVKPA